MCGIAGILDPRRARAEVDTRRQLDLMALPMRMRGPDAAGSWAVSYTHLTLPTSDLV